MEEMRVKTPVQTDFVQNVVSGGTRSTTLGVDTQTRNNSPKYMLYSYIYSFSAYLPQLAVLVLHIFIWDMGYSKYKHNFGTVQITVCVLKKLKHTGEGLWPHYSSMAINSG
jgi:hypothetical protein